MRHALLAISLFAFGVALVAPASAALIYNNLTPTNGMAIASRPSGAFEIEAADDFLLTSQAIVTGASFVGLFQAGPVLPSVAQLVVEIYRVFPADSNAARTPNVPTRTNSPSDAAFATRDQLAGELTFTTSLLAASFTALNSVQAGGIHPSPTQTTGGDGAITGREVRLDVMFTTPLNLPADHYFFVPQVALTDGLQFYWLSASRPITGAGTTNFSPDLQAWTRDEFLDPDWLRVGMDIVGGTPAPTFNAAFSLEGTSVPEPHSNILLLSGLAIVAAIRARRR